MTWDDTMIQVLRTLWAEGHSTAEIGRRMGVSKNAVIGKANSSDLEGRPSPIKGGRPPRISAPAIPRASSVKRPGRVVRSNPPAVRYNQVHSDEEILARLRAGDSCSAIVFAGMCGCARAKRLRDAAGIPAQSRKANDFVGDDAIIEAIQAGKSLRQIRDGLRVRNARVVDIARKNGLTLRLPCVVPVLPPLAADSVPVPVARPVMTAPLPRPASIGPIPHSKQCTWLEGDRPRTFVQCAAPFVEGKSWCGEHYRRVFDRRTWRVAEEVAA